MDKNVNDDIHVHIPDFEERSINLQMYLDDDNFWSKFQKWQFFSGRNF